MGAGSACASARRSDFVRPRSKNKIYTASKKAVRLEKDTKSLTRDFVLQVGAGSIYTSARRSDFVRPRSKNKVPYAVGTLGGSRERSFPS